MSYGLVKQLISIGHLHKTEAVCITCAVSVCDSFVTAQQTVQNVHLVSSAGVPVPTRQALPGPWLVCQCRLDAVQGLPAQTSMPAATHVPV